MALYFSGARSARRCLRARRRWRRRVLRLRASKGFGTAITYASRGGLWLSIPCCVALANACLLSPSVRSEGPMPLSTANYRNGTNTRDE